MHSSPCRRANVRATAAPMPRDAPVMSTRMQYSLRVCVRCTLTHLLEFWEFLPQMGEYLKQGFMVPVCDCNLYCGPLLLV